MKNYNWVIQSLLMCILLTPLESIPRRQSKKQGVIAQALQLQDPLSTDQIITTASLDKLSHSFPKKTEFGYLEAEDNATPMIDLTPDANTAESSLKQPESEIVVSRYDFPKELQNKAETMLKVVDSTIQEEEKVDLQFEDADLQNFVQQISDLFQVEFITDDAINPLPKGTAESPTKALKGNKLTFKTNRQFSRKEAWDLFITFLEIAGFAIVQQPNPGQYRIETIKAAQKAPIPSFIGIDYNALPDNDQMIRYLYFMENAALDTIKNIIPSLLSNVAGSPIFLQEQKAFLVTDKSFNIKSLMEIVKEFDKATQPQAMTVLQLKETDAEEVRKLYEELTQNKEDSSPFRPFGTPKQKSAIYFPENARVISYPQQNSLILLGAKDAIDKIEDFIKKHIDVALDQPYSPLYTYQLKYAEAKKIAEIMTETTKFGKNTKVGESGGVRSGDRFMKDMTFTPEPSSNKLIIKGQYEDYIAVKKIIDDLDKPQPQIALEVLILTVNVQDEKELGSALRSKLPGLDGILGNTVKYQTSGLGGQGIVQNPEGSGVNRLLGNLLKLVTDTTTRGTVVTFGQDILGVWGLFKVLNQTSNAKVISNPFLIASNKTPAQVSLGETRRVVSGTVVTASGDATGKTDDKADLTVNITPQINSDGMIVLSFHVGISQFTDTTDQTSGNKITRIINTQALVADKEVLALGGLIQDSVSETVSKTPILGDFPVLGWLFKNKKKSIRKTSLLILVSSKIIPPDKTSQINEFTRDHLETYRGGIDDIADARNMRDPIQKLFFTDSDKNASNVDEFLFDRHNKRREKKQKRASAENSKPEAEKIARNSRRRRKNKQSTPSDISTAHNEQQTVEPAIALNPPEINTIQTIIAPSSGHTPNTTLHTKMDARKHKRNTLHSAFTSEKIV